MTTEKMNWIENYLNAKTGDEDKDVDETLVHNWKPFTDEDIREVAGMLTKNDIRRYVEGKYFYTDDAKDFQKEFGIYVEDDPDEVIIINLYNKLWGFIKNNEIDEATWTKYFNWYNQFGFELSYEECIKGRQWWDLFAQLEATPIPLHKVAKEAREDMDTYWRRLHHERMNEWFEANVEGYKEFEDYNN